jgi:hypothetical protein
MSRCHRFLAVILLAVWLGGGIAWARDKMAPQHPQNPSDSYEKTAEEKMEDIVDLDSREDARPPQLHPGKKATEAEKTEKIKQKRRVGNAGPEAETPAPGYLGSEPGVTPRKKLEAGLGSHPFLNSLKTTLSEDWEGPKKKPEEGPNNPKSRN